MNRFTKYAWMVLVALAAGCSKDDGGDDSPVPGTVPGAEVLVRLPGVSLAAPVEVLPGGMSSAAALRSGAVGYPAAAGIFGDEGSRDLFSVTLGDADPDSALPPAACAGAGCTSRAGAGDVASGAAAGISGADAAADDALPATRADVALNDVWVFQFDASGKAVQCEKVATLVAGHPLDARLNSGEGYTIGVVAGGPADGLSISTVPDLATFREGLLFTGNVSSDEAIPYAGTLDGVTVLPTGQVQVGGSAANVPYITLRRILAKVTVDLTHDVDDYALDGVELYCVPVGAPYAADPAASAFPAGADANFACRDNTAAGQAPHAQSDGVYTWYVGPNRRGLGTGITAVQDKNASKAPAYATYARVKTHSTTDEDAPLYYDIYLGEDMFTDFNITANHVYNYATRIVGTAAEHYSLLDTDGRVSGKKPVHIESATHDAPATIPGQGATYGVTLTGTLPSEGVPVRVSSGSTALATGTATTSGTAVSLTIPAYTSDDSRTVSFEYQWNGTWIKIGEDCTQQGYNITSASHNAPATIPGTGGTYSVTLKGVLPSAGVPVRASSGGTALVTGTATASDKAVSLAVPANTSSASRTVSFEYNWNGEWIQIGAVCTQSVAQGIAERHGAPEYIAAGSGTYTVLVVCRGPGVLKLRAVANGQVLGETSVTLTGTVQDEARLTMTRLPNIGAVTKIQYEHNGQWVTVEPEITFGTAGIKVVGLSAYTDCPNVCSNNNAKFAGTTIEQICCGLSVLGHGTMIWTGNTNNGDSSQPQVAGSLMSNPMRLDSDYWTWHNTWTVSGIRESYLKVTDIQKNVGLCYLPCTLHAFEANNPTGWGVSVTLTTDNIRLGCLCVVD